VTDSATSADAALAMARRLAVQGPREWVPLDALGGRVLAETVRARTAQPLVPVAAMDGWATGSDSPSLRVVGESSAGRPWDGVLAAGEAVRISTGAVVPAGADRVIRRERGAEDRGTVTVDTVAAGQDVRAAAEDFALADVVLDVGHRIRPHDHGVIAACGWDGAFCRRRPRVAIVAGGDELIPAGNVPGPGEVIDSNRHALGAAVVAAGGEVVRSVVVGDRRGEVRSVIAEALARNGGAADLVITSGGASVGDHDHVRTALADLGASLVVGGVAMRPGHPTALATRHDARILVLPGTPGGALAGFQLLGRELLGAGGWTVGMLAGGYPAIPAGRDQFVPCRATEHGLVPAALRGAMSLAAIAGADALAWVRGGHGAVPPGGSVAVSAL
jgi:molybdopterin molybdotransferase